MKKIKPENCVFKITYGLCCPNEAIERAKIIEKTEYKGYNHSLAGNIAECYNNALNLYKNENAMEHIGKRKALKAVYVYGYIEGAREIAMRYYDGELKISAKFIGNRNILSYVY
ncbi:MAG: hypothetical protein LUG95_00265 [Clostridiales bacterium]|nr:hypothetical protein [Clostridiales bacterium]